MGAFNIRSACGIPYSMEQVIRRKRKKAVRKAAYLFAAGMALLLILCVVGLNACVAEPIRTLAEERARELAASTMSFAVVAALESERGEMLSVTQTGEESWLVIADTAKVNAVAGLASADAQQRMSEIGRQGISFNAGDLSGLSLLCGSGPKLTAGFSPVGSITAETVSSLSSAGINQSIYSIDLILTARIRLVIGGRAKIISVRGSNPICQTVIVGKVPQVYTNVANEDDMLNLIPTELP